MIISWELTNALITLSAVLVALFLPYKYERKKLINLSSLVEKEIEDNIKLLKKAKDIKDVQMCNGLLVKELSRCAILATIDLTIWDDNKQVIAEISSEKFSQYFKVVKLLSNIKMYSIGVNENDGDRRKLYLGIIKDGEIIDDCLNLYSNLKK